LEGNLLISGRKSDVISYILEPGKLVGNIIYLLERSVKIVQKLDNLSGRILAYKFLHPDTYDR
jgi:hypothetical protein